MLVALQELALDEVLNALLDVCRHTNRQGRHERTLQSCATPTVVQHLNAPTTPACAGAIGLTWTHRVTSLMCCCVASLF
jgi:hypothetical protein